MRNGLAAVLLALAIAATVAACEVTGETSDEPSAPAASPPAEDPPAEDAPADDVPAGDTVGDSAEPDTGRMSQGEYETFSSYHQELVEESLQWSEEYQTCTVIGQTGDLAGFRECVQEAWEGTEGAMLLAYQNADDLLGNTAKQCRQALRKYRDATDNLYSVNLAAYEAANALDFEEGVPAFDKLPKAATRYGNASTNVLKRCEPR